MHRLALLLALATACKHSTPDSGQTAGGTPFPDGFRWGAALSGFQADPGCPTMRAEQCEDRHSDWYQWVTDPDLIADPSTHLSGEPLADGPGHWELYPDDFALAADDLNLGAIRVSIEWSRLFPNDPGDVTTVEGLAAKADPDAVAAYDAYFDAIQEAGMTPLVTLNHYTLPLWIHDGKGCHEDIGACSPRGWLEGDRMVDAIALYAGYCARTFGDRVKLWATLNEPLAVVLGGYVMPTADRTNPPGIVDIDLAVQVLETMEHAHAAMYDQIHANDSDASVGVVTNLIAVKAEDPNNADDVRAAQHLDYLMNQAFLNATIDGTLDTNLDGTPDETDPSLSGRMDWVGINYYTRVTVRGLSVPLFPSYPITDFYPTNLWEEYPEGIREVSDEVATRWGLPIYITENGTDDLDNAADRFLLPHLEALHRAIDDGADVRGYFVWTLMDNYEWNHGMSLKFGLYEVDVDTKERTPRPWASIYSEIARSNRISE